MTIKEAQEAVDQWIKEYGVRYFSELTSQKKWANWHASLPEHTATRVLRKARNLT